MYYYIKEDKIEELKDGRKANYLSELLGINYANFIVILNGAKCKKTIAIALISIKEQIPINSPDMEKYLEYYFTKAD